MKTIATLCAVATALGSFSGIAAARDHRGDADDRRAAREERREERRDLRHERRQDRRETRAVNRGDRYVYVQPAPAYVARAQPNYVVRTQPGYTYGNGYGYGNGYDYYQAPRYTYSSARPSYYVGGYVPTGYRQPTYYVNDWQSYDLYAPPYGHQWVRTDTGDYLLMALATGIIASLILNR